MINKFILGEKWFNSKEVIRIVSNQEAFLYTKKIKVYSETFNNYKWMEPNFIKLNYRKLIPVALMTVGIFDAVNCMYNLDSLFINIDLNPDSAFVDSSELDADEDGRYSSIFINSGLVIRAVDDLNEENEGIINDKEKTIIKKWEAITDKLVDDDMIMCEYECFLFDNDDIPQVKQQIKIALYVNDYYDSITNLIDEKLLHRYNHILSLMNAKIKQLTNTDFQITSFKKFMESLFLINNLGIRVGIDEYPIKEVIAVDKNKNLNTLYKFDHETMMKIVKYTFYHTVKDYMILKFWHDIDVEAINQIEYKYRLIRNNNTGDLFIMICKTGRFLNRMTDPYLFLDEECIV